MMSDARYERDEASVVDEAGGGEMDELLVLLEQKDSDLRRAAELGKMLLDEKEADAEAHEGEKEALWRRIQDMARRVMELEQEAVERRDSFLVQQDHHHHHNAHNSASAGAAERGSWGSRRFSPSSGGSGCGGDRAEERALRAKNEMLERQLAHMKEVAEETQLELAAAKKARFFRKSSSNRHSRAGSGSLLSSPALSPQLGRGDRSFSGGAFSSALGALTPAGPLSPGRFSVAVSGHVGTPNNHRRGSSHHGRQFDSRMSSPTEVSRWSVPSPRASSEEEMLGGGGARGQGSVLPRRKGGNGDGEDSEASNDELRAADRAYDGSAWRATSDGEGAPSDSDDEEEEGEVVEEEGEEEEGEIVGDDGNVDERDAAWLLEQNAWLMEELEAKDELIEALREQILQQQNVQQEGRWRGQGSWPSSSAQQSLRDVAGGPADSDDSDDDGDGGDGQRSFLDDLLHRSSIDDAKPSSHTASSPPPPPAGSGPSSPFAPLDENVASAASVTPRGEASPDGGGAASTARRPTPGGGDAASPNGRRTFGGILAENAMQDAGKPGAEGATERARRASQSKSPARRQEDHGDGENSPCKGVVSPTRHDSAEPLQQQRQQQRQRQRQSNASLSPARAGGEVSSGGVTGVVGQTDGFGGDVVDVVGNSSGSSGCCGSAATVGVVAADAGQQEQAVLPSSALVAVEMPRSPAGVAGTALLEPETMAVSPSDAAAAAAAAAAAPTTTTAVADSPSAAMVAAIVEASQRARDTATVGKIATPWATPSSPPPPLAPMNRAERKSRQAMEKLGLRAVKGVFRMTMKTSNGVVFVVKAPDVFKHPKKSTYVAFGTAETDRSGSEVRPPSPRKQPTTSAPLNGGILLRKAAESPRVSARPDPLAVETEAVAAGLDPADVLTVVTQAGCGSGPAIDALRQAQGDVVNAVMSLTDIGGAGASTCA